jgi:hypothetical protein
MHVIEHTYVSLLADVARLTGYSEIRGSYEGLQWCLIEAPQLEKYMLACLERDEKPDLSRFPHWLQRLAAGSFLDPVLLRYLRQLLLFCYKAYVEHDQDTTENAFKAFFEVNARTGEYGASLSKASPVLLNIARKFCQSVLYRTDWTDIKPSHGPGASITPKERWSSWFESIDYVYPYSDYMYLYFNRDHCDQRGDCTFGSEIRSKLIAVPKDSRGPRLICVHPAEAIWIQQGVRRQLERAISRDRFHRGIWPRGKIHFDDQSINGRIAFNSSRTRRYATLDMKEASDRISEPLVQILFGDHYKYFGCCRAQNVYRPGLHTDGDSVDIHSYAPMGNATTFPVQSLVFWAICSASLQYHGFHQPGAVFVFGDDIIVPTSMAEIVINDLESFGLLVNRTKSFWRSGFRESCGVDAFNGVNVTPIRWKTTMDAEHISGLQSLSDTAMRLRMAGYTEAASTAYWTISRRFRSHGKTLPFTDNPNHGGIAEYSTDYNAWSSAYWHRSLHKYVTPVYRTEMMRPKASSSDWNHVLESVISLELNGRSHVPDRTVSRRSKLVRGWIEINGF